MGLSEAGIQEEESGTENMDERSRGGPAPDLGPVAAHQLGGGARTGSTFFEPFALFDRTRFGEWPAKKMEAAASPGSQGATAKEPPVEARVHAALRSQQSTASFHRALRQPNNTTQHYASYL